MNCILSLSQCDLYMKVGESVAKPLWYYHNNITSTLQMLDIMGKYGCKQVSKRQTPTRTHTVYDAITFVDTSYTLRWYYFCVKVATRILTQ